MATVSSHLFVDQLGDSADDAKGGAVDCAAEMEESQRGAALMTEVGARSANLAGAILADARASRAAAAHIDGRLDGGRCPLQQLGMNIF